jgi:hypothetical protein
LAANEAWLSGHASAYETVWQSVFRREADVVRALQALAGRLGPRFTPAAAPGVRPTSGE